MATKDQVQYSLRMQSELYEEVKTLSKLSNSTMSKFILSAIEEHVVESRKRLKRSLSENLEILNRYSARDPDYRDAIDKVVDGEVSSSASAAVEQFYDTRNLAAGSATKLEQMLDG